MRMNGEGAEDLRQWIAQTGKLQTHLQQLQTALTQRLLGEEHHYYSPNLREAKQAIKDEIAESRDRMLDALIASVAVCHAWADPFAKKSVALPDTVGELEDSLSECRRSFHRAMSRAAEKLGENRSATTPVFAHLIRRMAAFHALFELSDCVVVYLKQHQWEGDQIKSSKTSLFRGLGGRLFHSFVAFNSPQWLWHDKDSFRLAVKTSVGMFLASLFVAVPFLWQIASPFGVWPGLTIASVNFGSSVWNSFGGCVCIASHRSLSGKRRLCQDSCNYRIYVLHRVSSKFRTCVQVHVCCHFHRFYVVRQCKERVSICQSSGAGCPIVFRLEY